MASSLVLNLLMFVKVKGLYFVIIYTRRMQCIVGSLEAVYTAAIFDVVQNYTCELLNWKLLYGIAAKL